MANCEPSAVSISHQQGLFINFLIMTGLLQRTRKIPQHQFHKMAQCTLEIGQIFDQCSSPTGAFQDLCFTRLGLPLCTLSQRFDVESSSTRGVCTSSSSGDSSSAQHAQINCVLALMMIMSEHVKFLFSSAECLMMNDEQGYSQLTETQQQ